ncbi:MAG: hypothetical protein ACMUJM_12465 [bacterium]
MEYSPSVAILSKSMDFVNRESAIIIMANCFVGRGFLYSFRSTLGF